MRATPRQKPWYTGCLPLSKSTRRCRPPAKDAKTALQEWLQGRKMKVPQYTVVATVGAAHRQTFDVECHIPDLSLTERGTGGSRRAGEQAAAAAPCWPP